MKGHERVDKAIQTQLTCGDIDIRIAADGAWFHNGGLITRSSLVNLFSSILERDEDGDYWLVTPVERARIIVEDAPFVASNLRVTGNGKKQILSVTTNTNENITVNNNQPISFRSRPNGEVAPYIRVRNKLDALASRQVWYELAELFVEEKVKNIYLPGIWSCGQFFPYLTDQDDLGA